MTNASNNVEKEDPHKSLVGDKLIDQITIYQVIAGTCYHLF